jgi:hypothetical protein
VRLSFGGCCGRWPCCHAGGLESRPSAPVSLLSLWWQGSKVFRGLGWAACACGAGQGDWLGSTLQKVPLLRRMCGGASWPYGAHGPFRVHDSVHSVQCPSPASGVFTDILNASLQNPMPREAHTCGSHARATAPPRGSPATYRMQETSSAPIRALSRHTIPIAPRLKRARSSAGLAGKGTAVT